MILNWMWENFGLIEYVLCIELVILLSAGFFYQVAKLIARQDRRDPLVKFYRVFWQSFFSSVTPVRDLDMVQIEAMARASGIALAGDLDVKQLSRLDAPDLTDLDDLAALAPPSTDDIETPQTQVRTLGRTGPEDSDQLRSRNTSESRELRFAREQKAKREAEAAAASAPAKMPVERDDEGDRISISRDTAAPDRKKRDLPTAEIKRAAISRCNVRIEPLQKADRLIGYENGEVVVEVIYAPEDGHANGVIINLLAERIDVRPYQIALVGGHYKVRKVLQVAGLDQPTLDQRLAML
jgi:uncharacterized protein YggU (UPF0235/DUF167 family)